MTITFVEKVKLRSSNLVMTYRGVNLAGKPYFAYIYCTDDKQVYRMHDDYKNQVYAKPESYGEVIYSDNIPEPDEKALEFLKNWLADKNGELM